MRLAPIAPKRRPRGSSGPMAPSSPAVFQAACTSHVAARRSGRGRERAQGIGRNVRWPDSGAAARTPRGYDPVRRYPSRRGASPTMSTPLMDPHRTHATSTGSRRGWGALAAAGVAGLVLAACSGSTPHHTSSGTTSTVDHHHHGGGSGGGRHLPAYRDTRARGRSRSRNVRHWPSRSTTTRRPGRRAGWTRPTSSSRSRLKGGSPATPPCSSASRPRSSGPSGRPATSTSGYWASWVRPCWLT